MYTYKLQRRSRRSPLGMGTAELAGSAMALAIIVVLCVDVGVLMLGNQVLDRAARDATRSAAAQRDKPTAVKAAKAALAMHKTDGTYIAQPTLTSESSPDFVYQDYQGTPYQVVVPGSITAGNPTGDKAENPTVTVTCQTNVKLPASLGGFGLSFGQDTGSPLITGKINFRRRYTFPIVRQSLNPEFGGS